MALTMPQSFLFADDIRVGSSTDHRTQKTNMWKKWSLQRLGNWLMKDESGLPPPVPEEKDDLPSEKQDAQLPFSMRRTSKKVIPGLQRAITFRRQDSERRDRLVPCLEKKRATSADRQSSSRTRDRSPPPVSLPSMSAPEVGELIHDTAPSSFAKPGPGLQLDIAPRSSVAIPDVYPGSAPLDESFVAYPCTSPISLRSQFSRDDNRSDAGSIDEQEIQEELITKWILNLSMHFRDLSDREKFFITYAEEPNKWRKVTVSVDYRDAPPGSLEEELKGLHYQRDKSARIYESIRDSLRDIQFYETVTNLKLQTDDGRLHVHVTEDLNEIVPYPSISAVEHIDCKKIPESAVLFDSHISGFVYKVAVGGNVFIKKEIPSPDTVEEFLYEVNALYNLQSSSSVIRFEGIIVDESGEYIKGLLISFAEQGALVDLMYDLRGTQDLAWSRRERWARQIVQGLSEIHESGFVQGDFTLSNIVIDANDEAKIIDINRRGCPVGWEPPELSRLIQSGQRVSIYIGVKSDLFQLGMVLWALAEEQDEPERQDQPLSFTPASLAVPEYFKEVVQICLSDDPRQRLSARDLLARFPRHVERTSPRPERQSRQSVSTHRSDKEYIDPAMAVGREDIDQYRTQHQTVYPSEISTDALTFADGHPSTEDHDHSSGSYIVPHRRPSHSGHRNGSYESPPTAPLSTRSLDDSELDHDSIDLPDEREGRWEQVYIDRDTRVMQRSVLETDSRDEVPEHILAEPHEGSFHPDLLFARERKTSDPLAAAMLIRPPDESQLSSGNDLTPVGSVLPAPSEGQDPESVHHSPDDSTDRNATRTWSHESSKSSSSGQKTVHSPSEPTHMIRVTRSVLDMENPSPEHPPSTSNQTTPSNRGDEEKPCATPTLTKWLPKPDEIRFCTCAHSSSPPSDLHPPPLPPSSTSPPPHHSRRRRSQDGRDVRPDPLQGARLAELPRRPRHQDSGFDEPGFLSG